MNVHFLRPFFFLESIISTAQIGCCFLLHTQGCSSTPLWLLSFWVRQDLHALIMLLVGSLGSSRVVWFRAARNSHFFWTLLCGSVHCTALPHCKQPLGSSPASARSYSSSWYRHLTLASRMAFSGKVGKETQLSSCLIWWRVSKLCVCLLSPCLSWVESHLQCLLSLTCSSHPHTHTPTSISDTG